MLDQSPEPLGVIASSHPRSPRRGPPFGADVSLGLMIVGLCGLLWWCILAKYPEYAPSEVARAGARQVATTHAEPGLAVEDVSNSAGKDFWHFFAAAEAMRDGRDIYDAGLRGYLYPPMTAALLLPLVPLGCVLASRVFFVVCAVAVLLSLWLFPAELNRRFGRATGGVAVCPVAGATARAGPRAEHGCDASAPDERGFRPGWWRADADLAVTVAFFGLAVASDPCRRAFSMIQTDPIILLCLTLGLVWIDRRPVLCGLALGLAANIKYHAIIFLPYLLLRRRWRAAGACAVSVVFLAMLPAAAVGWETNLGYWQRALGELAFVGSVEGRSDSATFPITWHGSVSIPSAIARGLEAAGFSGDSQQRLLVPMVLVLAGGVAALVWWMYRKRGVALLCRRRDPVAERVPIALEWTGLIVATLVFSPQTTKRHMLTTMLLGGVAGVLMLIADQRRRQRAAEKRESLAECVVVLDDAGMEVDAEVVGRPIGESTRAAAGTRATPSIRWLMVGVGAALIGLYFPPNLRHNASMAWLVDAWNAASMASWGVLTLLLMVVWQGLKLVRDGRVGTGKRT